MTNLEKVSKSLNRLMMSHDEYKYSAQDIERMNRITLSHDTESIVIMDNLEVWNSFYRGMDIQNPKWGKPLTKKEIVNYENDADEINYLIKEYQWTPLFLDLRRKAYTKVVSYDELPSKSLPDVVDNLEVFREQYKNGSIYSPDSAPIFHDPKSVREFRPAVKLEREAKELENQKRVHAINMKLVEDAFDEILDPEYDDAMRVVLTEDEDYIVIYQPPKMSNSLDYPIVRHWAVGDDNVLYGYAQRTLNIWKSIKAGTAIYDAKGISYSYVLPKGDWYMLCEVKGGVYHEVNKSEMDNEEIAQMFVDLMPTEVNNYSNYIILKNEA